MISGIGVDIESITNFKKSYKDKHFLDLIFTKEEIKYCQSKKEPYISFAGKFCAKEAVIKAHNKKILIKNIEIINLKSGKIIVKINGRINNKIKCSISHKEDYAVSFVTIEDG